VAIQILSISEMDKSRTLIKKKEKKRMDSKLEHIMMQLKITVITHKF